VTPFHNQSRLARSVSSVGEVKQSPKMLTDVIRLSIRFTPLGYNVFTLSIWIGMWRLASLTVPAAVPFTDSMSELFTKLLTHAAVSLNDGVIESSCNLLIFKPVLNVSGTCLIMEPAVPKTQQA
jgi:hypothetical protein